jgi:DNA-binding protein YbaB
LDFKQEMLKKFLGTDNDKNINVLFDRLALIEEYGESGGGFVKVIINGKFQVVRIDFENSPIIMSDAKMFADLIRMATNIASQKILKKINKEIKDSILEDFGK